MFVVTGAKWNLTGSWLLNANVLIRMTDTGLSARVTPSLSIDYGFERSVGRGLLGPPYPDRFTSQNTYFSPS